MAIEAGMRTYQKAHFTVEGRLRDYYNCNGKFVDKVIMGISKKTFDKNISKHE